MCYSVLHEVSVGYGGGQGAPSKPERLSTACSGRRDTEGHRAPAHGGGARPGRLGHRAGATHRFRARPSREGQSRRTWSPAWASDATSESCLGDQSRGPALARDPLPRRLGDRQGHRPGERIRSACARAGDADRTSHKCAVPGRSAARAQADSRDGRHDASRRARPGPAESHSCRSRHPRGRRGVPSSGPSGSRRRASRERSFSWYRSRGCRDLRSAAVGGSPGSGRQGVCARVRPATRQTRT